MKKWYVLCGEGCHPLVVKKNYISVMNWVLINENCTDSLGTRRFYNLKFLDTL